MSRRVTVWQAACEVCGLEVPVRTPLRSSEDSARRRLAFALRSHIYRKHARIVQLAFLRETMIVMRVGAEDA